uniref:Uncharacterized protein n=1 Tax=Salmonella phage vB_Si_CECAV_FGS009 TaxID=3126494 RepID=A0AAU6PY87_9CAUD
MHAAQDEYEFSIVAALRNSSILAVAAYSRTHVGKVLLSASNSTVTL